MRNLALFALLFPLPALADQIVAESRVTAVTVFPEGAEITREVAFSGPAGTHELLVPDLPAGTSPELLRPIGSEGLVIGAVSLRTDRLPPRDDPTNPALAAAKAEVEAREADLQAALAAVDAVRARVQAAEAQVGFLGAVRAEGASLTPEAITALSATIGTEVLAARQAALAASADLPAAEKAVTKAQEALDKARAAETAVLSRSDAYATLSLAVTLPAEGAAMVTVQHFVADASWMPVYDLMLTRGEDPAVTVRRGVLVSQFTGEDWRAVDLTLSTAAPMQQAAPSVIWSELRQIVDPEKEAETYARAAASDAMGGMAEPVMEPAVVEAAVGFEGDTVVYRFPAKVDVASGVEDLRLALDEKRFAARAMAWAVPRHDRTAFHMARFANDSGEILLPGDAFLFREGVLVGSTWLEPLAPGAEVDIAFGAIEGLRLKRDMPKRAEGDRGLIRTSTQREEVAVLEIENLTTESWTVHVEDGVPYSEQEDLEVSFAATPEPSETDVDGRRGVLAWDIDIAPGETRAITLTHTMRWPEGMELR